MAMCTLDGPLLTLALCATFISTARLPYVQLQQLKHLDLGFEYRKLLHFAIYVFPSHMVKKLTMT